MAYDGKTPLDHKVTPPKQATTVVCVPSSTDVIYHQVSSESMEPLIEYRIVSVSGVTLTNLIVSVLNLADDRSHWQLFGLYCRRCFLRVFK